NRPHAANELDADSLPHLLNFAHQNAADLPGARDVCAAAGGEVEVADINQPDFAFALRQLAQAERARFVKRNEANLDRAVLHYNLVAEPLGGNRLLSAERLGSEINRARLGAHVKRNRGQIEEAHERAREHMLASVLLHVIEATLGIDGAVNPRARLQMRHARRIDVVHNTAAVGFGDFGDARLRPVRFKPASVENLAAAGGVESGYVEDDTWAVAGDDLSDLRVEGVEEGIA